MDKKSKVMLTAFVLVVAFAIIAYLELIYALINS